MPFRAADKILKDPILVGTQKHSRARGPEAASLRCIMRFNRLERSVPHRRDPSKHLHVQQYGRRHCTRNSRYASAGSEGETAP